MLQKRWNQQQQQHQKIFYAAVNVFLDFFLGKWGIHCRAACPPQPTDL